MSLWILHSITLLHEVGMIFKNSSIDNFHNLLDDKLLGCR